MMETAGPARPKEEPSCASQKVIRTRRVNDYETFRLQEKLKIIDNRKAQKNVEIDGEKDAVRKCIEKIKEVKKDAGISVERRRHLQSLGFSVLVNHKPNEEKKLKVLRRKSIAASARSSVTTLSQETRVVAPLVTRHSESSFGLLSHLNVKLHENSSFQETKLYRFRNIQPPIRSGSRRNFIQLPKEKLKAEFKESNSLVKFDPCSKLDHRGRIVLPPGCRRPSLQCGPPWQGREISVASKNEDPDDTAKTPGTRKYSDWLERECDDDNAKVAESASSPREPIQDQPEINANNRPGRKSLEEQQLDTQELSVSFYLNKRQFQSYAVATNAGINIDISNSRFCHVTSRPSSSSSSPVADMDKELSLDFREKTTQKDSKQCDNQKDKGSNRLRESRHCDNVKTVASDSPKSVGQDAWSKTKSNVFDLKETVKPQLSGIRTNKLYRPASDSELMRKRSDEEFQTASGAINDTSPQNEKIEKPATLSSAVFKVNSRDFRDSTRCIHANSRKQQRENLQHDSYPSYSNKSHNTNTKLAQVQNTKKIQGHHSVVLPSPPRTSPSFTCHLAQTQNSRHSTHSSRVRSADHRNADYIKENVLAYDARPDKSLNKGYTTMQITLRGKQVKVFVPRFPNEADDAMVERARARSLAKTGASHRKDTSS